MKKMLTFAEKMKVYKRLKEVCHKKGDFAFYDAGFNDKVIAIEFNCTHVNVASIRKEMIGQVPSGTGGGGRAKTVDLIRRVTDIEDYLTRQHPGWREYLKKD